VEGPGRRGQTTFVPGGLGELNFDSRGVPVTGGATRTWTGRSTPGYWPGIPSWASGGTVVVPWWHSASQGMIPAGLTGITNSMPWRPAPHRDRAGHRTVRRGRTAGPGAAGADGPVGGEAASRRLAGQRKLVA
jgi:hypothetical protein